MTIEIFRMEIPHLPQERKRVVVGTLVLLLLLLIIGILVAVSSGKGRFSSCECIFKDFLGNWNFKTFFEQKCDNNLSGCLVK